MITIKERRRLAKVMAKKILRIIEEKSHDYGNDGWQDLGLKGNFADVHKKYVRLKELVWKGVKPRVKESVEETYLDLTGYGLLGMILTESEKSNVQKRAASREDGKGLRRAHQHLPALRKRN